MIRLYQRAKIIHLFLCALFGVTVMPFGGIALAATAPTVTKLEFKDTMGTPDPSDDKVVVMSTGYGANKPALDGQGDLYVTDAQTQLIYRFNSNAHLNKIYDTVHRPLGVAAYTSGVSTHIYAGGYLNGYNTVFILDKSGATKGILGGGQVFFGLPNDITIDSIGNVFVVDSERNVILMFNNEGVLVRIFGPYKKYFDSEVLVGTTFVRTRHTMVFPSSVTAANGELYVAFKERVEHLDGPDADFYDCLSGSPCYADTEGGYQNYSNTSGDYKNWYSLGEGHVVAVIDINTGEIKRKVVTYPFVMGGYNRPAYWVNDFALDKNGRLYAATNTGIRVFDALRNDPLDSSAPLTVSGFLLTSYNGVTYDADTSRLFATTSNTVVIYGIDNYTNPVNTPPAAPILTAPKNTYTGTFPTLEIANAVDNEADPLTYGYEIRDSAGIRASVSGVMEGSNGKTFMDVDSPLAENTLYRWRAQAFDGNAATWSGEAEFCVNEKNDNPSTPTIIGPNGEKVSPFSSSLSWNPSSDPDCYDTFSYTVGVSNVAGFSTTVGGIGSHSLSLSNIKGLLNGMTYSWRVKAVDNNGGESSYSEGSFVYNTTVVRFESGQSGAKVYIDGNYGYFGRLLGQTPVEVQDLTPGSHFVTFVKAGYEPYHTIVNVADPMVNDSVITVSAGSDKWVKASRIEPEDDQWVEIARVGGYASPFVVDYNNDGLKDMIVGGGDGKLYLYLSEETVQADGTKKAVLTANAAVQAGGADITVGTRAVPFVVDYNNDGRKDLLIGSGDGLISLYLNTGDENAPALTSAGTIKDSGGYDIKVFNSAPVVVDYNNDGKKDLVVGGFDGKLRLYKNIGTDASPEFDPIYGTITALDANLSIADINVGSNSKPFFTDWNSDGKKDLVVGREIADSEGSTVNLFLNVGTDDSPSFATAPGLKKWIMEKKKVRGNREFIPYLGYNHDPGNLGGDASPFVVDWDGSSARDVVVGNSGGGIVTYISE